MKLPMLPGPSKQKGVLILCLGVIFATLSLGVGPGVQYDPTSRDQSSRGESQAKFQRTFQLAPNGRLLVDNYKGKISIEGWDRKQVVVDVYKNFEGRDTDRKSWMSETDVRFFNESNRLEVDVKYPDHWYSDWFDNNGHYTGSVELTIHAPRQVNLELRGHKPEMRVSSVQGNIEIKSYKSPIVIESTVGAIRINTYKDTVRLTNIDLRGRLDLRMYKGEALVDLKGMGDGADLETSKGQLVVRLPETEGLSLEVEGGRRVSFHSDFPIATEVNSGYLVRGTINQGGPRVRLHTQKGSISLEKRGGA